MRRVMECFVGYDPGGSGNHGFARLTVSANVVRSLETETFDSTEHVLKRIEGLTSLDGIGVDTLTCWSTGKSGWRPADRWLRKEYKEHPDTVKRVISPNFLYGSMVLNGMAIIVEARKRWPDVYVTETHPKVLYRALTNNKHDFRSERQKMMDYLGSWIDVPMEISNDHEWDAAISAWAAYKGKTRAWETDLHRIPEEGGERLVWPGGITEYRWPDLSH